MKTAGGLFLWGVVIYLFFTKFAARHEESYDFKRRGKMPPAEIVGNEQIVLTTADVERAFASSIAPTDDA
jgi:putative membrane protein